MEELSRAIAGIVTDPELERRMGEESQRIIKDFDYENATRGYREAISSVLAQR